VFRVPERSRPAPRAWASHAPPPLACPADKPIPVVGLGASTGGIEAFREFFGATPRGNGFINIVVLHLAPERASMLVEILGHWTQMTVGQAVDGTAPERDHVYVISPKAVLTLQGGVLRLRPAVEPRHVNSAIDALFASMAKERGENAVGIVLSDTGSDGALGLKAIKECGGVTLAHGSDGTSPEYSGMPSAAIATGAADLIVPVGEMPARILTIFGRRGRDARADATAIDPRADQLRRDICTILLDKLGHDFSHYKEQMFSAACSGGCMSPGWTALPISSGCGWTATR
jgi:two-component system CheB/CheR fusion protein